jgi:hypothetical protein
MFVHYNDLKADTILEVARSVDVTDIASYPENAADRLSRRAIS